MLSIRIIILLTCVFAYNSYAQNALKSSFPHTYKQEIKKCCTPLYLREHHACICKTDSFDINIYLVNMYNDTTKEIITQLKTPFATSILRCFIWKDEIVTDDNLYDWKSTNVPADFGFTFLELLQKGQYVLFFECLKNKEIIQLTENNYQTLFVENGGYSSFELMDTNQAVFPRKLLLKRKISEKSVLKKINMNVSTNADLQKVVSFETNCAD